MRKPLCLLLTSVLMLTLAGCGIGSSDGGSSTTVNYADSEFIDAVSTALEKRWAVTDSKEVKSLDTDSREYYAKLSSAVEAELNTVSKYRNSKFKDHNLQELAVKYINALEDSKKIADDLPSDDDSLYTKWDNIYDARTLALQSLVKKYGLEVSKKYENNLDDLINNAKSASKENDTKKKVDKLVSSLDFKGKSDGYGLYEYTATLKNTTGLNFNYLNLEIDLLDKDNVVVDQQDVSLNNVSSGSSYKAVFQTEQKFDHYKITPDYEVKS